MLARKKTQLFLAFPLIDFGENHREKRQFLESISYSILLLCLVWLESNPIKLCTLQPHDDPLKTKSPARFKLALSKFLTLTVLRIIECVDHCYTHFDTFDKYRRALALAYKRTHTHLLHRKTSWYVILLYTHGERDGISHSTAFYFTENCARTSARTNDDYPHKVYVDVEWSTLKVLFWFFGA